MRSPIVLIVVTKIRPEERAIIGALEARGLTVIVSVEGRDLGSLLNEYEKPSIALLRCLSQSTNIEISKLLKDYGIPTVNTDEAIRICCSKVAQALLFQEHNVPTPESRIAFGSKELEKYGDEFAYDFVIKPSSSSWGRGVTRIRSKESLDAWTAAWETHDASFKDFPVVVQKFVEKPGYDVRVVIVNTVPIVAFRRVIEHWKTNTHLGATVVPCEITNEMKMITEQVIDVIGHGIYGLDIFEQTNSSELLVCEVNQNPEFARSSLIHGVNISEAISRYVAQLISSSEISYPKLSRKQQARINA